MCHSNGFGTILDKKKAFEYYQSAADLGNSMAEYKLGCLYTTEFHQMDEKANELFISSAKKNNSASFFKIGKRIAKKSSIFFDYFEMNEHFGKDFDKAIKFIQRAAILGNLEAIKTLLKAIEKKAPGYELIENDTENIIYFYLQLYHSYIEVNLPFTAESYLNLANKQVKRGLVEWNKDIHLFWKPSVLLNQQILTFLLVSKFRNQSNIKQCSCFVKGISMKVVKFFCQLNNNHQPIQKRRKKKNTKKK